MVAEINKSTPTMARVIQEAINNRLMDLYTAMPGEVKTYNTSKNTADVQPLFKRTYLREDESEETVSLPLIRGVPVAFPRAGTAAITFPLKAGDMVMLVFMQRSIDEWKGSGGEIDPNDTRAHDISDAVAYPGLYPSNDTVPIDKDHMVVRNERSKITVKSNGEMLIEAGLTKIDMGSDGKLAIGNGSIDLLTIFDDVLTALQSLTVSTAMGPSSPPVNVADFIKAQLSLGLIKK